MSVTHTQTNKRKIIAVQNYRSHQICLEILTSIIQVFKCSYTYVTKLLQDLIQLFNLNKNSKKIKKSLVHMTKTASFLLQNNN